MTILISKQQKPQPNGHAHKYRNDYKAYGDHPIEMGPRVLFHSSGPFELGAWCLVVGIALIPAMFVFACVLLYTTFG